MDQSPTTQRKLVSGLALAGFVSGILSIISLETLSNLPRLQELRLVMYVPGVIFGVVVAAYYAICGRMRSWARLLAFVAASTGAYFLAVWLSVLSVVSFRPWGLSRDGAFYGGMFVGGLVGGFVILSAAQLLLLLRRKWKVIFGRAILWSLAGGLLGVVGFALGGSVGKVLWLALHALRLTFTDTDLEGAVRTQTAHVFSLFVLWQTCMAPLLGWLVARSSAAQSDHQSAASTA